MRLVLDTGVLGQICHPRKHHDVRSWFRRAVQEHELLVSEVADYELRRELLRIGSQRSIDRLDELTRKLQSAGAMLQASDPRLEAVGVQSAFVTDPWGTSLELTEGLERALD